MENKSLSRNLLELIGSVMAAVVVVKGIIATVPDAIMLDLYGEIHGMIQLALGLIALVTFGAVYRWLDNID